MLNSSDTPGIHTTNWHDPGYADLPFGLHQALFGLGEPGDPDSPVLVVTRFDPNATLPIHSHPSAFCDAVVEGSMVFNDHTNERGTIRILQPDVSYGPSVAGPEGCTLLEFYAVDSGRPGVFPPEARTPEWDAAVDEFRSQQRAARKS